MNSIPANAKIACRSSATPYALLCALCAFSPAPLAAQPSPPSPVIVRKMHDAIAAAQAGNEPQALTIVDSLIAAQPHFVPGLKLQGMLLEDMGRQPDAARAYSAALALAPADPEMLLKVGIIELLTNHPERAATLLEHRLRLTPADEETSYYLAQALHLQGRNDRALTVLKAAIAKNPSQPPSGSPSLWQKYGELLLSTGDTTQALTWLLKARQADPAAPRIDFDLAVATYNSMDLTQARDYALAQARATPQDIDNLLLLATIQVKLADWAAADTNLQRVVGARPGDSIALVALGHCELELQRYPTAIAALQRALQADPSQILAHFFLARAYAAQGNADSSQHEAALYREVQQHPAYTLSKDELRRQDLILAQARQLLADSREPEALKLLAASEHGPNTTSGSPWVSLGATYLAMGNTQAAERSFNHALALDPATPDAHTYLGYLALQQGELPQAEAAFQAELTRDPNQTFATAELGDVRYRQQRWAEAAALLTRSKTTSPTLLYLLCDSYFRLGNPQKAALIAETVATFAATQPEILPPLESLLRRNDQNALADRLAATSHRQAP